MKNFIIFFCVNFGNFYRFFHILILKAFKGGSKGRALVWSKFFFLWSIYSENSKVLKLFKQFSLSLYIERERERDFITCEGGGVVRRKRRIILDTADTHTYTNTHAHTHTHAHKRTLHNLRRRRRSTSKEQDHTCSSSCTWKHHVSTHQALSTFRHISMHHVHTMHTPCTHQRTLFR